MNKNTIETLIFSLLGTVITAVVAYYTNNSTVAVTGFVTVVFGAVWSWFTTNKEQIVKDIFAPIHLKGAAATTLEAGVGTLLPFAESYVGAAVTKAENTNLGPSAVSGSYFTIFNSSDGSATATASSVAGTVGNLIKSVEEEVVVVPSVPVVTPTPTAIPTVTA